MSHQQSSVWQQHARQWHKVGTPLRPCAEDGELMLSLISSHRTNRTAPILVLGVTPELIQLPWPASSTLCAIDHSPEMIASLWRPNPHCTSSVLQAKWQQLPLPAASGACIVGDGCLNVLPGLTGIKPVLQELNRVLIPDGILAVRVFIRPELVESLTTIQAIALAGQIFSFHALKWRIAMALATAEQDFAVGVATIHAVFNSLFSDRRQLAARTGWSAECIDTIDAYQGQTTQYTFPTLPALLACCAPYFRLQTLRQGHYELADCCPTIALLRENMQ